MNTKSKQRYILYMGVFHTLIDHWLVETLSNTRELFIIALYWIPVLIWILSIEFRTGISDPMDTGGLAEKDKNPFGYYVGIVYKIFLILVFSYAIIAHLLGWHSVQAVSSP